jgi:hypothetical protein
VFSYLPVKVGDTLTEAKAAESIKALFATGFFKDVRIEVDNGVMIVVLEERPAIAAINFAGMKEFEKDTILKALKETGIAEGRIFDRGLLEKAEQELKRQYLTRGKYASNITTTVTPLERNRVGINFTVEEGSAAKIRLIAQQQFALRAELAQRQKPVVELTAALQRLSRRPAIFSLLRPGSLQDAVHLRAVLETMLPEIGRRTAGLRAAIARSKQLQAAAEQASANWRASQGELNQRRQQLE